MPGQSKIDHEHAKQRLGQALRALRLSHNMTQDELANASGIHVTSLRDYENGRAAPAWHTLTKIARAFGVTMEDIGHAYDHAPARPQRRKIGRPKKQSPPAV